MSGQTFDHAVLFTGHMIDAPGRTMPRFPPRAENSVRSAVRASVLNILALRHEDSRAARAVGIAGGASGGDLLFHEACEELEVPTFLRLALPIEEYLAASVAPAGPAWVRRFYSLVDRLGPNSIRVLDHSVVLPESLTRGAALNIWQRTNLWMLEETVAIAPRRTLLALWDGNAGNGAGGTEHLVTAAPGFGIDVAPIIRIQTLFS